MRCLNCGFENMPGLEACARCGSSLELGDVSVIPGRASTLRLRTRFDRFWNRISAVMTRMLHLRIPSWLPRSRTPMLWPALARTALPGLGHIHTGQRFAGWAFLSIWLVFLLLGLLTLPSWSTPWFFSAAVATHAAAVTSVLAVELSFERIGLRVLFGILLFIALRQLVYAPIGGFVELFWVPINVPGGLLAGPVTQAGDGVIYEGRWLRPDTFARGDLVFYRIPATVGDHFYSLEGLGLDRIVGVSGDVVSVNKGKLLVNGHPPEAGEMPIGNTSWLPDLYMVVSQGHYAILPTRISFQTHNMSVRDDMIRQVSMTPGDHILGRIRFRLQPWSRFGRVE